MLGPVTAAGGLIWAFLQPDRPMSAIGG